MIEAAADADRWVVDGVAAACGLLDARGTELWQTSALAGTGGGTFGGSVVVRLESPTRTAIAKLVKSNDLASDHPSWWRRELDVYRSAWLDARMPAGMGLPDCLGSTTTDEAAVIVLAELSFDRAGRTIGWYGDLAEHLGHLNGAGADGAGAPPWATRRFIALEAEAAIALVPDAMTNRATAIAELIDECGPLLERFVLAGAQLVDALHSFPLGLHHLDAFSRNATQVGGRFVLIDWAYTGLAPVGCDAAAVIAITAIHGDVPGGRIGEFHDAVVDGYAAGLRSVGAALPAADLQCAIDLALTLRFVRFLTQLHGIGDTVVPTIAAILGRPFPELMASWMALANHVAPSAERALAAVDG